MRQHPHQRLEEGCLAHTIAPHQCDAVTACQIQIQPLQDGGATDISSLQVAHVQHYSISPRYARRISASSLMAA